MEPRTLPGGLLLRTATAADAEALAAFNRRVHGDDDGLGVWTRDLVLGRHPSILPSDFLVVTEPRDGAIVSSMNLIVQRWTYDGVGFGVGQPELVGTDPAYRNRGLVREQFAVVHRWCEERDLPVQAIGGIPWYYRQFGYDYALPGWTGRRLPVPDAEAVASAADPEGGGDPGSLRLRPAGPGDAALLAALSARADARSAVTQPRDEATWRHEVAGHSAGSGLRYAVEVIEDRDGPAGILVHSPWAMRGAVGVLMLELDDRSAWPDAAPVVVRHLIEHGRAIAEQEGTTLKNLEFGMGEDHPIYALLPRTALPFAQDAWYVRVPDLTRLVRALVPALERRLAVSPAAGVTGELRLSLYRSGLRLALTGGRLTAVEPLPAPDWRTCSAAFPDLTFLKLLFGYRSLDQLVDAYPDVIVGSDPARAVLTALFPRRPSMVWHTG